jgi:hypothetical protein
MDWKHLEICLSGFESGHALALHSCATVRIICIRHRADFLQGVGGSTRSTDLLDQSVLDLFSSIEFFRWKERACPLHAS